MQNTAIAKPQQPKGFVSSLMNPFGANMPVAPLQAGIVDQTNKQQTQQPTLINKLTDKIKFRGVLMRGVTKPQKTQQVEEEVKRESLIPPQQTKAPRVPQVGRTSFAQLIRDQQQPTWTVGKPVSSKKRDIQEFESEYIMKPAPMVHIIEDEDDDMTFPLPSPIYKSDFNIIGDDKMQYVAQEKPVAQAPVATPQFIQPVDVTLYIPHVQETPNKATPPSQAFDEFERYLQSECDLIGLKSMIEGIERQELTLNEAFMNFKQVESDLKNDTRSLTALPQTQFANQTNFFEFHPHLIYSEPVPQQPQVLPVLQSIVQDESQNSGFVTKDLAYSVNNQHVTFWKPANPMLSKVSLGFSTYVLGVCMLSTNKHILISTVEEFHVYEMKTEQDGKFSLISQSKLSTDRTCYGCLMQLNNKRIFVGGEKGKISELQIEGVTNSQNAGKKMIAKVIASYIKDTVVQGAKKVMGIKPTNSKKMLKKDHEAEQESTKEMIAKFFGSFFQTKDPLASKVVTDIIEDAQANLLFVAVSDSENASCIEIFDVSKNGFTLIRRITFEDLAPLVKARAAVQDLTVAIEISKLHFSNNELTISLINGHMITLNLKFQEIKPSKPQVSVKKVCEYSLIQCLTPQLEQFLDKYDSLFDQEYLPDNITDQILWKPLPAMPVYMSQQVKFKGQAFGLRVIDTKIQNNKVIMLIQQTLASADIVRSFVVFFTPNYRRGKLNKYTQYLIGITEVQQGNVSLGISLSLAENQRTTKVTVLTDTGLCNFMIPESEDFMYQYLQLLIQAQTKSEAFYQRIQSDFDLYIKGQDLEVTLEALMKISLAQEQKMEKTATFVMSNFTSMFYQNQNLILSAPQSTSRFMSQQIMDPRSLRNSLLSVVKYVNNHLTKFDNFKEISVTHDIATLATTYFLDFSQTANQLVASPIMDSIHMHAYPHLTATPMLYESLRFPLFYNYLNLALKSVLQEKLFKIKDLTKVERALSIRETDLAQMRISQLLKFLQNNQTQLSIVSVEADFFSEVLPFTEDEVPKNLKCELQQILHLTLRCSEALILIVNAGFTDQSIKNVQTKELAKSLSSIKVEQVLFEGIQKNPDVCNLIEHVINYNEARVVQEIGMMKSFISAEAFSVFVGKKYLAAALTFKAKKILDDSDKYTLDQLKQQGYRELMAYPLRVNLVTALEHLMQLDMILESANLCLKCIDLVDDIKSINMTRGGDSLIERVYAERLPQQKAAIQALISILREIITRIQVLQGQKVNSMAVQEPYLVRLRARLADTSLTVDYLKDLKWKLLRLAASTKSDLFQIELCDLLYKCNQLQDLKFLKSSALAAPQMQTMIANLAKQQVSNQETLMKGKLEALYTHHVQAKSWGEAFLVIMDQVCFQTDSKIEINDRFTWLQKAEGCLIKYQQQMSTDYGQEDIPQDTIAKLFMFKDYFLVLIQLKDIAQERQAKYKIQQEFIDKLKFVIIQPDDLCMIALELHQWTHFLSIIEINELIEYPNSSFEGKRVRQNVNLQETQQRIDFMYKNIISRRPLELLQSAPKKLKNLNKWLKQLHSYAAIQEKALLGEIQLQMFPKDLVLQFLDSQSQQYFNNIRKGVTQVDQSWDTWWSSTNKNQVQSIDQWSPFWCLDFMISKLGFSPEDLFNIVQKKGLQPEALLSQSYVLSKWLSGTSKEVKQIVFIVDKLGEEIKDEMLYPKTYVENIRAVISKVQKQIDHPQRQNSSSDNMIPQQ